MSDTNEEYREKGEELAKKHLRLKVICDNFEEHGYAVDKFFVYAKGNTIELVCTECKCSINIEKKGT